MARTIPRAADTEALEVSSDRSAEASYPEKAYCASSSPIAATYRGFEQPVSLTNSVKTNSGDWWWDGTIASAPTITATPPRCHHTLIELSRLTSRTPKRFSTACSTRMQTKMSMVDSGVGSNPHWSWNSAQSEPERIEITEKLMAKLPKPPIRRARTGW